MYKLEDYPLAYESIPTDNLMKKITERTRTLKLKALNTGWVAQIRINRNGQREEVSAIASNPREALEKLDSQMEREGIYHVPAID